MLKSGFKNRRYTGNISVTFSLKSLALSLFFIFCIMNANTAFAGSATLSRTLLTTNVDSTPLTDL